MIFIQESAYAISITYTYTQPNYKTSDFILYQDIVHVYLIYTLGSTSIKQRNSPQRRITSAH
ncbi:hypothetical protein NTGM5_160005 [Candidatus Nitrotoga sp. M5]|nr:hypothetical protein NTGM5_160005 [Candidatus Nitrotoga sp. M5]